MDPKRKCHTIKSRCACVWNIWWIYMVANLILLCSLKTYLSFETWKHLLENRGYLIHLFFSGGHLSTHCFKYLGHLSIFFSSSFFYEQLLHSLMSLFCNRTFWEIVTRTWSIYLVDGKPIKYIFVFTPSVGVEHFLVDLDGRHVFAPTPSVGVVHMWVVCMWS